MQWRDHRKIESSIEKIPRTKQPREASRSAAFGFLIFSLSASLRHSSITASSCINGNSLILWSFSALYEFRPRINPLLALWLLFAFLSSEFPSYSKSLRLDALSLKVPELVSTQRIFSARRARRQFSIFFLFPPFGFVEPKESTSSVHELSSLLRAADTI